MRLRPLFRSLACLALAWLASPHIAVAQVATSTDSAAVVAVVQRFFDAMARGDTVVSRAVLAPGARLSSMRTGASGTVRHQSDSEYIAMIATSKRKFLERMWNPSVSLSGDIASVWTPYDFHLDGKFSHCGIDIFDLLRTAAGWQIVSAVYTAQTQGCAPSPLGPVTP